MSTTSLDGDLFDFFCSILLLQVRGAQETELVMGFQQLTGPVMKVELPPRQWRNEFNNETFKTARSGSLT